MQLPTDEAVDNGLVNLIIDELMIVGKEFNG